MSDGLNESWRSKEIEMLKARIDALESMFVGLEFDLFMLLAKKNDDSGPIPRTVLMKTVAEMVATKTGYNWFELRSDRRERPLANARHLFWYMAKEFTGGTMSHLGRLLDKDHTSVIHGIRRIKARMETEPDLKNLILDLSKEIRAISEAS